MRPVQRCQTQSRLGVPSRKALPHLKGVRQRGLLKGRCQTQARFQMQAQKKRRMLGRLPLQMAQQTKRQTQVLEQQRQTAQQTVHQTMQRQMVQLRKRQIPASTMQRQTVQLWKRQTKVCYQMQAQELQRQTAQHCSSARRLIGQQRR